MNFEGHYPEIKTYADYNEFLKERSFIMDSELKYVGTTLMVPNSGDYYVLPHFGNAYYLYNQEGEYFLISNICLHRQATLLEGKGNTKSVLCPVHHWVFKPSGELLGTPHMDKKACAKHSLEKTKLHNWKGMLFTAPFEIPTHQYGVEDLLDFKNFELKEIVTDHYDYDWKTFLDVYLENYHVGPCHPGLRQYLNTKDLTWHFGENYSVQLFGLLRDLTNPATETYREWQNKLMKTYGENLPKYGSIWTLIYPNIMLEWYPNTIVVSTIYPTAPGKCVNYVEMYYHKDIIYSDPEFIEKEKAAYFETAKEDEAACLRLEAGRKALNFMQKSEYGPLAPFLEDGTAHFYNYLAKMGEDKISTINLQNSIH